ncbi:hypothetical protein XH79_41735 [Bradyrhizobium sp. CCBAU 45389]|nr:hypothetical protein [Bradyrhizobium sp. CCBAU 45389]
MMKFKGAFEFEASTPVKAGDPVYAHQIAQLHRYELAHSDIDAGHLTIFRWRDGGWRLFFDFQRNKGAASNLVASAEQFARTAELAKDEGLHVRRNPVRGIGDRLMLEIASCAEPIDCSAAFRDAC